MWIDCEMTGLDLARDALIEVAVLVTDAGYEVEGDFGRIRVTSAAPVVRFVG